MPEYLSGPSTRDYRPTRSTGKSHNVTQVTMLGQLLGRKIGVVPGASETRGIAISQIHSPHVKETVMVTVAE